MSRRVSNDGLTSSDSEAEKEERRRNDDGVDVADPLVAREDLSQYVTINDEPAVLCRTPGLFLGRNKAKE